ncbi:lytic murein transglycosylase B [Comamonadaceae bacterium OH2545_COT-014]|nr:lytic murein transglycosylase B [Comamonadaceae bacterium OH2545_COT-014]
MSCHPFLSRRAFAAGALAACGALPLRAAAQPGPGRDDGAASADGDLYQWRDDALRWADDTARRLGLDAAWARQAVGGARFVPQIARLILPAARGSARNWRTYRSRFIDPVRVQAGARFWAQHRPALARAESRFGVPAQTIVGIIGVETIYGRDTGRFRVIDALATLTFDFPAAHPRAAQRQAFFASELAHFLQLCRQSGFDPAAPLGSYAGAMGLPQFMPSSWLKYAIDFDGDGRIDLWGSPVDAIGSVANYFRAFGWRPGLPTHYPVQLAPDADLATLLAHDILPTFSPARFSAHGAQLPAAAQAHAGPLALVALQNGDPALPGNAPTYVAGTENFYVITRYNWSAYYALAVIELGREVAAALRA